MPVMQPPDVPNILPGDEPFPFGSLTPSELDPYPQPRPLIFPPPPPVDPRGTPDLQDIIDPNAYGVPTGTVAQTDDTPLVPQIIVPYFRGSSMLTTFAGMKEYAGSGRVSYSRAGWRGTRIFEVPWSQWMDFANALLGYSILSREGFPIYFLPDVFAEGMPWMFCREIDMEPIEGLIRGLDDDQLTRRIYYERAKLTCTYYPLDMDVEFRGSGQILQIPGSAYAWMGIDIRKGLKDLYPGGFPDNQAPNTDLIDVLGSNFNIGRLLPGGEFSLTRHYVPRPYFSQLLTLEGAVNDNLFLGFQPTTLLCTNIESRSQWTLLGAPVWDMTFKFIWQPYGWQALYNPNPSFLNNPQGGTRQAVAGNSQQSIPGFQFIRSLATPLALDQTTPSPYLIWKDGSLIGNVANNIQVLSRDLGFPYNFGSFDPILYFL